MQRKKEELVESLTVELASMVGYGARPKRIIQCRTLVEVTKERHGEVDVRSLPQVIVQDLRIASELLGDPDGEATRHLLTLDRRHGLDGRVPAEERRQQAIRVLGGYWSVETFRRHDQPDSPEMELMRGLALQLVP